MRNRNFLVLTVLMAFAFAVFASPSYADSHKYPTGTTAKAKVHGMDQLYVCTADVYAVFVLPCAPYAPEKDVKVVAPIKLVAATGNSPPVSHY